MEAGSYDAESRSDSLHFEINRGWKVRYRIIFVILQLSLISHFFEGKKILFALTCNVKLRKLELHFLEKASA